jgi:hypothetical protein
LWFPPAPRLAILETISPASTRPPLFKHQSIADEAVAWTCREKEREREIMSRLIMGIVPWK